MNRMLRHSFFCGRIISILLVCAVAANAQIVNYTFSQSNATYIPITNGTIICKASIFSNSSPNTVSNSDSASMRNFTYAGITLPFTFSLAGDQSVFRINSNGWLGFGSDLLNTAAPIASDACNSVIAAFGASLSGLYTTRGDITSGSNLIKNVGNTAFCKIGMPIKGTGIPAGATITDVTGNIIEISAAATGTNGTSLLSLPTGEISTVTTGTAPFRTYIVQFANMSQYAASTSDAGLESYTNFQIQLSEGGGNAANQTIKIVYGPSAHPGASAANVQAGLRGHTSSDFKARAGNSWSANIPATANTETVIWNVIASPSSGLTFSYTPPGLASPPLAQPTSLSHTTSASLATLSFSPASPLADKYLVVRSTVLSPGNLPLKGRYYRVGDSIGNAVVISNTNTTTIYEQGLTPATKYYYNIFSCNDQGSGGPVYNLIDPLLDSLETTDAVAYVWNGVPGMNDFTTPENWMPARNLPDPTDTLLFNNGGSYAVVNIQGSTIAKIAVANSTNVSFESLGPVTWNIATELFIAANSAMTLSGAHNITVAYVADKMPAAVASIAGVLNLGGGTGTIVYNTTNAITTVAGTLNLKDNASVTSSFSKLIFNAGAAYNHQRNGGNIPTAAYAAGSTVTVTGITSTAPVPPSTIGGDFVWNCALQTGMSLSLGSKLTSIVGQLLVINTGTGSFQFGTSGTITISGDVTISGGTLLSNAGFIRFNGGLNITGGILQNGGSFSTITIADHFNMTSGAVRCTTNLNNGLVINVGCNLNQTGGVIAQTGSGTMGIYFNGTSLQEVTMNGANSGSINIRHVNQSGIRLNSNIEIANNASVTITSVARPLFSGTGMITYSGANTSLIYNGAFDYQIASAVEWPAANSPVNVTINNSASGINNYVKLPGDRTIPGKLALTNGNLDIGTYNLTIGTSATVTGSIIETAGMIKMTSGSLTRWYSNTSAPVTADDAIGNYPIISQVSDRDVHLYFDASTAIASGGTIKVSHDNTLGLQTGLSVADGSYTINKITRASWRFTAGNGFALAPGNRIAIRITAENLIAANDPSDLRLITSGGAVGVHAPATGSSLNYQVFRTDLSLNDLISGPFHVGGASTDVNKICYAVNDGMWNNSAVWWQNEIPSLSDPVIILPDVHTIVSAGANAARSVFINNSSSLTLTSGSLTVDSAICSHGKIEVNGGVLELYGGRGRNGLINEMYSKFKLLSGSVFIGPVGGGNKCFSLVGGITVIDGGNLTVNGCLQATGGALNQTGGTITIDGNSGIAATSVPSGQDLFSISSGVLNQTFTGGTIVITDPPHNSFAPGSSRAVVILATYFTTAMTGSHTIQLGDGTSTTAGNSDGFVVETYTTNSTAINNLVVNGGSQIGRWVTVSGVDGPDNGMYIAGDLTIHSGSELRTGIVASNNIALSILGNIVNNGIFSALSSSPIVFGTIPWLAAASSQTISGTGLFRNNITGATANFRSITINNPAGIVLNNGNDISYSNTISFVKGNIITNGHTLIENTGASLIGYGSSTGWIAGKLKRNTLAGPINQVFPVGDEGNYTPVTISGVASSAVLTPGGITVGTIPGDHQTIGNAQLNPLKSVNRYFTIQTSDGISFTPMALNVMFNWNTNDVDAGAGTTVFAAAHTADNTNWSNKSVSDQTPTSIQVTKLGNDISGAFQVAEFLQIPLAMRLKSFYGETHTTFNNLFWQTLSEDEGVIFEIQRSMDGVNFSVIGKVSASGVVNTYIFKDEEPVSGTNYYRLNIIEPNGKSTYSKTIALAASHTFPHNLEIYPNPVTDKMTIKKTGEIGHNASVSFVDVTGKTVSVMPVTEKEIIVDMQSFPSGTYLIKYRDDREAQTVKITRQ